MCILQKTKGEKSTTKIVVQRKKGFVRKDKEEIHVWNINNLFYLFSVSILKKGSEACFIFTLTMLSFSLFSFRYFRSYLYTGISLGVESFIFTS